MYVYIQTTTSGRSCSYWCCILLFSNIYPTLYLGQAEKIPIRTAIGAYPLSKTQTNLCDNKKDICSRDNWSKIFKVIDNRVIQSVLFYLCFQISCRFYTRVREPAGEAIRQGSPHLYVLFNFVIFKPKGNMVLEKRGQRAQSWGKRKC